MNRDVILNMPAGKDMDILVAEKVMEIDLSSDCEGDMYNEDDEHWSCTQCSKTGGWGTDFQHTVDPKRYSEYIEAAWEVVEHFTGKECDNRDFFIECWSDGEWFVSFHPMGYSSREPKAWCDGKKTKMPSAPLAICRAALLAVLEGHDG